MPTQDTTIIRQIDDRCTNYLLCCKTLKMRNEMFNFYIPTKIQYIRFKNISNLINAKNKNIISDLRSQSQDINVDSNLIPTHVQLFFNNATNWNLLYPFLLTSPIFPLQLVRGIADSYEASLICINVAQKEDWCLYNITPKTLLIPSNTPYAHKMCISPTNHCLQLSRLLQSETCMSYIFNTILTTPSSDFMYKPIEIYVLSHLWKIRGPSSLLCKNPTIPKINEGSSISPELCDQICDDYINGLTRIFETMSSVDADNLHKQYLSQATNCVKQLINSPYTFIVQTMIGCMLTWDNYSISITYIILINVARNSHRCSGNIILNNIINLLLTNISPNLSNRKTVEMTLEQFNLCIE